MTDSSPTDTYDIAIIGAGIAGLTAAGLLSRAGLRVCVAEQASQPGGYLAGFERNGFLFDTSIHWLNQCGPGGIARKISEFIGSGAPGTRPQTRIRRVKGESFNYLLTNSPDDLREQLAADFPKEARGIRAFFRTARNLGESLSKSAVAFRTTQSMGLVEKSLFGLKSLPFVWPFIRYGSMSAPRGLDKFFAVDGARKIFCSEENFMSCLMPIAWAYAGDFQHPPALGSDEIPSWLCEQLAQTEADVLLNTHVTDVVLDHGRAVGIRLQSGTTTREIRAERVLAACDVDSLYTTMLPHNAVSPQLTEKIRTADTYESSVTLYVGLDCDPRELGLSGGELTVLTRDELTREEHNTADPHKAVITVFSPSLRNPSMAPQGKGTLTVFVAAPYEYADYWHSEPGQNGRRVRGEAYRAFKKEYANTLLERVQATLIPNLLDHVELCETATPLTFERYTSNRHGSMMGFKPGMKNMRAKVAGHTTPVPGLYLCGQWSSYGGGVPSAVRAATNTSLLVLAKTNLAYCQALKDVADGKVEAVEARRRLQNDD